MNDDHEGKGEQWDVFLCRLMCTCIKGWHHINYSYFVINSIVMQLRF